ncbi:hypothetical protein RND81_02G114800 [Saponaria officinalis]|uniref:RNase H type-1 domain-containing protein n=1 Tax=Saponaria officinalis TaxID=3572 RepID=A0AAW1MLE7_SAPOF
MIENNPQKITQFRPIGLCNVVYKVISKVIVNRIKPILPMLISPAQTTFVPKRQITDNVIIVQEILHSMRKKRLSRNFIHHTLVDMGFSLSLINLIMKCISTARLSLVFSIQVIKNYLDTFCNGSGQKIRHSKSRVFFSAITQNHLKELICNELDIDSTPDLGIYLGIPTINVTLLKSTLSTIPLYAMQTAKLLRTMCDDLDRKTRKFLWGSLDEKRSVSLVSWNTVTNQVLRAKYCDNRCDIDIFRQRKDSSNTWQGILVNVDNLKKGIRSSVGNGKSTMFWSHSWVLEKPLEQICLYDIPLHLQDVFGDYLPNYVLQTIASFELTQNDDGHDSFFWDLSSTSNCCSCGAEVETTLHILRDCTKARSVWNSINGGILASKSISLPLKEWLGDNMSTACRFGVEKWSTFFALAVWWLWRWRNARVFNMSNDIPINTLTFLQARFSDIIQAFNKEEIFSGVSYGRKKEITVRWSPPQEDWYVLNVDGASRGNPGLAGAGGLIRDTKGIMLTAFAEKLGHSTNMRAELMALSRGIQLAKQMGHNRVIVQTDSLTLVNLLQQTDHHCSYFHLLQLCKEVFKSDQWRVEVVHVYREANSCADWLANLDIDQMEHLKILEEPPQCLQYLLQQDLTGVAWPRSVPVSF